MKKTVDIDKTLETAETINPDTIEYPQVDEVPEGWPGLRTIGGKTWYQRALKVERMTGHKVLPAKYTYDQDWNIILNPAYKPEEECIDCEEDNGA